MPGEVAVGLIGTVLGAIATFVVARWQLPKYRAEARKLEAEASRTEWQTLRDEIARLDQLTRDLRGEVDSLKSQSLADGEALETERRENSRLRSEIGRLKKRVEALEAILKTEPITAEMQAALDKLDGGGK